MYMYGLLNGMIANEPGCDEGHFCCLKPLQHP